MNQISLEWKVRSYFQCIWHENWNIWQALLLPAMTNTRFVPPLHFIKICGMTMMKKFLIGMHRGQLKIEFLGKYILRICPENSFLKPFLRLFFIFHFLAYILLSKGKVSFHFKKSKNLGGKWKKYMSISSRYSQNLKTSILGTQYPTLIVGPRSQTFRQFWILFISS